MFAYLFLLHEQANEESFFFVFAAQERERNETNGTRDREGELCSSYLNRPLLLLFSVDLDNLEVNIRFVVRLLRKN